SLIEAIEALGAEVNEYFLYHMKIKGCLTCGCGIGKDNAVEMVNVLVSGDVAILASPIHMRRPTDSLTSFIEMLYHMCRFDEAIMEKAEGMKVAAVFTTDGEEDAATDASEMLQRLCDQLNMRYMGALTVSSAVGDAWSVRDLVEKMMKG
ncbi:MAG: hypothetical protein LBI08_02265, partial [Methanomassiliicoccaceae archaeon]|nr:hypothetical protein [Methanomassiliicoccaceae archaeon]